MTAQNTPAEPVSALHLAIEALEHHTEQTRPIERTEQAIAALRQAIASEQQVVAYKVNWPVEISVGARRFYGADEWENSRKTVEFLGGEWKPLYASPQPAAPQPEPTDRPSRADVIDECCARIKAADDAAADNDYMLDSDDCISVLRGTWSGPIANDCPPSPQAPQPVAVPHGYALVPVKPTPEMLEAGLKRKAEVKWADGATPFRPRTADLRPVYEVAAHQWTAMLAAAPQAPSRDWFSVTEIAEAAQYAEVSDGQFMSMLIALNDAFKARALGITKEGGKQ